MIKTRPFLLGFSIALSMFALPGMSQGGAVHPDDPAKDLLSHRAHYSLKLGTAQFQSGLAGADGSMVIEWVNNCDGWNTTQTFELNLHHSSGEVVKLGTRFAGLETKDGLHYRFNSKNYRNGEVYEQLSGRASLDGPGKGGGVRFVNPPDTTQVLPKGTVFPTKHIVDLVEGAKKGEKILLRVVFDGFTEDGIAEINAVVGKFGRVKVPSPKLDKSLSRDYWPIRLAFFTLRSNTAESEFEMSVHLTPNGVAREFIYDYGDFTIRGHLDKLEVVIPSSC